ncbi:MAG: tetratricopeptide repeat protein [Deltaproteobacteria bacterium]|nr:tetratricopeptide repeat protein [Deltaproteobacteria bacterium]
MAAKQLTRKELLKKEDGFITFSNKAFNFINDNKKQVIIGVGIFITFIIGIYGFNIYLEKKENKAFAMLEQIKKIYIETLNSKGFKEGYKASQENFEQLFKKFPNSVSVKSGLIIYGNIAYFAEDYEKAVSIFQKALDNLEPDSLYKNILLSNIAYSNLMIEKEEKAMEYFEKISANNSSIMKDSAFLNLGIFYEKKGDLKNSREQFEQIAFIKGSMFASMIKEDFGLIN